MGMGTTWMEVEGGMNNEDIISLAREALVPDASCALAGEMTAQELRTVQAVLKNRAAIMARGNA